MKGLFQCPPWAKSFCPFRACCLLELLTLQGMLLIRALTFQGVWGKHAEVLKYIKVRARKDTKCRQGRCRRVSQSVVYHMT